MGKASYNLSNRMKALSDDRKKNMNNKKGDNILDAKDAIANCKAKIRQCQSDMETVGESTVIKQKISQYEIEIKKFETLLK